METTYPATFVLSVDSKGKTKDFVMQGHVGFIELISDGCTTLLSILGIVSCIEAVRVADPN